MNILITGTGGFIGYSLALHFLKKTNYKIIGLDNLNNYYSVKIKKNRLKELNKYKNFKFFKIDLKDNKKVTKLFNKQIDAVYHLAAQAGVRYSLKNPRVYLDSNVQGFFNLIENIKIKNIKKFFYASSSSVYGDSKKFPLTEVDPVNPKNFYGLSKKNNEEMVDIFFSNSKTKCVGFRFFTVFGEYGRPDMLVYQYLQSMFNKKKIFFLNNFGNHTRDFTYIADVCEIMFKLLKKKIDEKHQVFNICSNKPIKITTILRYIDRNFSSKPKIKKRKFQLADVKKTHGQNKKIKTYLNKKKFFDVQIALNQTCTWYKKNWKLYFD